ncbi:MAG: UDP-N-acetylglucosamine--LPS N-acetylglucosamine transferase [Planctomycetota bacterium]
MSRAHATRDHAHNTRPPRILAVASGGGHWVQLLRLRPAWAGHDVAYVTVQSDYRDDIGADRFHVVNDATRWNKFALALLTIRMLWIVLRERPNVVVSTGAAPGVIAMTFGKMIGARTLWLDSIANVDTMSMSGRKARRVADCWLTQWPELATREGSMYGGSVL